MCAFARIVCIVPLLIVGFGLKAADETTSCGVALQKQQSSLSLDYDAFDQTPQQGWRALAQKGCLKEAVGLIESYLDAREELGKGERRNLSFHAGQMLAMENDYAAAIPHFELALKETEPADARFKWNAYVNATIAFLKDDRETLEKHHAAMVRGKELHGSAPNLDVVEALLRNLGKPYKEAYSDR